MCLPGSVCPLSCEVPLSPASPRPSVCVQPSPALSLQPRFHRTWELRKPRSSSAFQSASQWPRNRITAGTTPIRQGTSPAPHEDQPPPSRCGSRFGPSKRSCQKVPERTGTSMGLSTAPALGTKRQCQPRRGRVWTPEPGASCLAQGWPAPALAQGVRPSLSFTAP